jgi:cell division protein FtsB
MSCELDDPIDPAGITSMLRVDRLNRRDRKWIGRALCFAACVLAANALIGERGLSETLRARQEFREAVSDLSRLQYDNAVLFEEIQRLRHDARAIEGVARAELGLIKPGEILVVVKQPAAQP